jgi:hypothetical protein
MFFRLKCFLLGRKKLPDYIKGDINVNVERIRWFKSEKFWLKLNNICGVVSVWIGFIFIILTCLKKELLIRMLQNL